MPISTAPPSATPGQAFKAVFNLRVLLVMFGLCSVFACARMLSWYAGYDSEDAWFPGLLRYTRQTLLSGLTLLLGIACAEAWLAHRPGAKALPWQALAIVLAAATGAILRNRVAFFFNPKITFEWVWMLSIVGLWSLMGGMAYALFLRARQARQAEQTLLAAGLLQERLQTRQVEAQLSALNAQIEPHFLFNTLANVKRLYETSPERGRDMLRHLIAYLRAALPSMRRADSTLGEELELVRNYLSILQMRMGARLGYAISAAPELLSARLPPMVLATLVENAIKHGLAPLPEGGHITIRAHQQGAGMLIVEVADTGQGFCTSASAGSGVGLANTRARLHSLFGPDAALELEAASPRGVVARLRLPCGSVLPVTMAMEAA
ncbi:sensor histidine kinase [Roseateles toxinivorans]|uniref:Histidine kinase n=1 Tax=Roseateles toxinivorans TaxID=270368 RepID=A0A4R6QKG6_9BURK|nr:histidine kinase [Roseateles toxinivorans]TDP63049.1 histidine kinase [Roseateles toxinivorans]